MTRLIKNLGKGTAQTALFIGTSNYNGAEHQAPFTGGTWIGQVRTELSRRFPDLFTVASHGLNGKSLREGGLPNIRTALETALPDSVVFGYAINDAIPPFEAARLDADLEAMIRIIRECKADAEILLHNIMSPQDVPDYSSRTRRPHHKEALAVYQTVADRNGLLHINSVWAWEKLRTSDLEQFLSWSTEGVHPTADGNRAITTPLFLKGIGLDVEFRPPWEKRLAP